MAAVFESTLVRAVRQNFIAHSFGLEKPAVAV